ncbi:MAG: hypothetical protein ACKPCM_05505 [Pseudanabaena sp.]
MRIIDHVLTIAKKKYFTDLVSLSEHPKVRYVLELPYDYILFEFYDELFDVIYNDDPKINHEVALNPELNEKVRQLGKEQENLLQPLYSEPSAYDQFSYRRSCLIYFLRIKRREYQVRELGKSEPIAVNIKSLITNFSNQIEFEVRFKVNSKSHLKAYAKVLQDWHSWAKKYDQITSLTEIDYRDNLAKVSIVFKEDFEDFLVALIVMLYETRKKTSVDSIFVV